MPNNTFNWSVLGTKAGKEGGWAVVVAVPMAGAIIESIRAVWPDLWLVEHDVAAIAILTGILVGIIKGIRNFASENLMD